MSDESVSEGKTHEHPEPKTKSPGICDFMWNKAGKRRTRPPAVEPSHQETLIQQHIRYENQLLKGSESN